MNRIVARVSVGLVTAGAVLAFSSRTTTSAPVPMPSGQAQLERNFDAAVSIDEMRGWLRQMSSEPNHVGSPHDKSNAEWELAQFRRFGWDAHIETFDVLYPTPLEESVEILGAPTYRFTLQEPAIAGDTSATASQPALPAYL